MEKGITRRSFSSIIMAATAAPVAVSSIIAEAAEPPPDRESDGAVLKPGKPYFPMLLGNGTDHVLIGFSGAMGACAGHEHWSYGTTHTGWFRTDRKSHPFRGVLNLVQCGYIIRQGIHADGIDSSDQTLDARTGILETRCRFANADVRVRTFLTTENLLVHRFTVSKVAKDMGMQFFVRTPSPKGPLAVLVDPEVSNDHLLAFAIQGEGETSTAGWLLSDHAKATRVTCYNRQAGIEVPLSEGEESEFTFVVHCSEAADKLDVKRSAESASRFNYAATLGRHQGEWQQFDSRSSLNLPKGNIEGIYNTSLYTVRAHQHPLGGITVGAYPGMWTNGINSYDVSYSMMALLGSNRMMEAEQIVKFWQQILPTLRQRAKDAGFPGIACSAPISPWGESVAKSREQLLEERHFITINIALHVWHLYQYSGRLKILEDYWDCLAEPVEFLLSACVKEFPNHAEIIRSSGPNGKERIDGKVVYYPNPIRTLLATIEAVRAIREAAQLLGKKPDPRWERLLPKLERGINANRFGGLIRANRTPKAPPRVDAAYLGLFNCLSDEKTFDAEIERATGPQGLMRWPDHGYRVVPWSHLNVSAALSRLGRPGAARMLETAARFTTTLHGFPEAIRPDGIYYKTWYPTTHAAFVHATNLLLARSRGDVLELFAGLPAEWGDSSFRSLRVPKGLLVSASRRDGKISGEVSNESDNQQSVTVRASGAKPWEITVSLKPGEKAAVPS